MDPTPFFIMGTMFGSAATLLIQAYGRRKVRQIAGPAQLSAQSAHDELVAHLQDRLVVLERLATDNTRALDLHHEIETLR